MAYPLSTQPVGPDAEFPNPNSDSPQFDESDWLGGDALDHTLSAPVDTAKLDAVERPGRHVTTKSYRSEQPLDKSSPHFHPCDKCNGSGNFTSWAGRRVGPCRACHGKGGAMRAVTVEQKRNTDAAKHAHKAHKAQKLAADLAAFINDHSVEYAWMSAQRGRFEFAQSMYEALFQYGSLTEKQLAAVQKCVARDAERKVETAARVANAPVIDTDKLLEALNRAKANGLKKPKLRFEGFQVQEAPATGKNAGALYVMGEGDYEDRPYFGKIVAGKFLAVRSTSQATIDAVVGVMNDPMAAAIAYGKRTGQCSCCGRELTDPVSIENGIGPICASKFGF